MLLSGCDSWCLTAEAITRLRNWQNNRFREMCRVTIYTTFSQRITSVNLQKRTGVFPLANYLVSRTLLWDGHAARIQSRSPKRLVLRAAALARHQGFAGRYSAVHNATRRRSHAAPRHFRRRGRLADALSPAPQQQPSHILLPPLGEEPSYPALSHQHNKVTRRHTKIPRGNATQRKPSYFSDLATPYEPSNSAIAHEPFTYAPTHTSALFAL